MRLAEVDYGHETKGVAMTIYIILAVIVLVILLACIPSRGK
jgi:hypothetical protein